MSFSIYVFLLVTVAVATVHPQIFNQCRGQTRVTCTPNVVFQKVINGTVTLTQCTNRLIREDEAKHCSECCQDFGKEMRAVSSVSSFFR
ncbi:hypothetical protein GCK72_011472 [Caenorhabditis remanei]|uniref:Uncharacterized protein n=1 Tax=Caenorhabditis remanei TaxID=31234 RepID=A0A6A5H8K7_CAERE|nr:hypothetical protein GCK72_011472 [Caenorhabditis remanei]KAF1763206.1 hypothetical protein GCK72_011472 [Caenorhabditis remanei]